MNAGIILNALKTKHSEDVFIPECKTGPTQIGSHMRLDAWIMKKSWTKPLVVGYEIKVSRRDFIGDEKWVHYLPFCNEFYWVCPYNLIKPNEVSDDVGLMYVSDNGSRVYTKKKAKYRDIKIPENIWRYILMSRVNIHKPGEYNTVGSKEYWERWLVDQNIDREFGRRVGKRINQIIKEKISSIEQENKELRLRIEGYEDIRSLLKSMGLDPDSFWKGTVERRIRESKAISNDLINDTDQAIRSLTIFKDKLVKRQGESENECSTECA